MWAAHLQALDEALDGALVVTHGCGAVDAGGLGVSLDLHALLRHKGLYVYSPGRLSHLHAQDGQVFG